MTSYSSCLTDEQIGLLLAAVENASYVSRRDGCRVVLLRCIKCGRSFEEELGAARRGIEDNVDPLCLDCDPASGACAFTGVTVQFGWR